MGSFDKVDIIQFWTLHQLNRSPLAAAYRIWTLSSIGLIWDFELQFQCNVLVYTKLASGLRRIFWGRESLLPS